MSVLDTAPKTSVKLLVGRERELGEVVRSIAEHRMTVVLGPRRIGKTSLVKTALSVLAGREKLKDIELTAKFIPIYVDMWAVTSTRRSRDYFFEYLSNTVTRALEEYDAQLASEYREMIYREEEELLKEGGVATFLHGRVAKERRLVYPRRVEECLDQLNALLGRHRMKAALAIDEAQELGLIKPFSPTAWLAHVHDHLTQIHVLLSGSYVGVLKRVLEPKPRDPLYGRDIRKIYVRRLDPGSLLEIFVRGLEERRISPSGEFSSYARWVLETVRKATLAQVLPLAQRPHEVEIGEDPVARLKEMKEYMLLIEKHMPAARECLLSRLKELEKHVSQDALSSIAEVLLPLIILVASLLMLYELGVLDSILVYEASNVLMSIGFDASSFSSAFSEKEQEAMSLFKELSNLPGYRAFMVLSLFALSGHPHLVISLVKKLPKNFGEEDLFKAGLEVLEDSYKVVCSEVSNFIRSYSKKPEILLSILYSLYEKPRTTGELLKSLPEVDKKSVIENLKTLVELGYIDRREIKHSVYYFITDPLLFYALKERCIAP